MVAFRSQIVLNVLALYGFRSTNERLWFINIGSFADAMGPEIFGIVNETGGDRSCSSKGTVNLKFPQEFFEFVQFVSAFRPDSKNFLIINFTC